MMLAMQALLWPLVIAAGFQQTPLEAGEGAQFFIAPVDDQGSEAIFLADADALWVYLPPDYGTPHRIALPADAAYVDVADLDGDGAAEVIVMAGSDVYAASLASAEPLRARASLTSAATASARGPVPTYLAHRVDGQTVFRAPSQSGYESLVVVTEGDGYVLAPPPNAFEGATPTSNDDEDDTTAPLEVEGDSPPKEVENETLVTVDPNLAVELFAVTPPQVAPVDGAEYVMRPYGEIAVARVGDPAQYQRSGTVAQARDAADRPAEDWPWFHLQAGANDARALYALDPPDFDRTLIRIAGAATAVVGPARLYPGAIVPPRDHPPDFNGDGWADLLLWRAPAPTFSLSSLTRWAQTGRWSLDLMTHLFDPEKMRYAARPAAVLRTRVPLVGFLEPEAGLPVSLWTVGDFDGDGQDDLLLKTEPRRLDVWLYRGGFAEEPDAALRFPAPVTAIEFAGPLAADGAMVLAVRMQDGRHLVWFEE